MSKDVTIDIGALELDCGVTLPAVLQRVTIDGEPSPSGDNVVFAPHALTGSSRVAEWWPGIAGGSDALFDRTRWCIIGINVLGGNYGSTGPCFDKLSMTNCHLEPTQTCHPEPTQTCHLEPTQTCHPEPTQTCHPEPTQTCHPEPTQTCHPEPTQTCHPEPTQTCHPEPTQTCHPEPVEGFPRITVRDMVRAQQRVFDALGIERIGVVIGGSLGGMQALQWALDAPERVGRAIVIGAHDHQSAMGIALNAVQRDAIALDPVRGIGLARKIAMLTYKSEELFTERHGRRADRRDPSRFDVEGYLDLQADRFLARMDGETYTTLTHAMDSFDVRDRVLKNPADVTFVGISSDWLFRPQDVRAAANRLAARFVLLESDHGHDAFLAQTAELSQLLRYSIAVM